MTALYSITVGADPEIMLFDKVKQRMSAVIGHLGGTKNEPRVVERGAVQEDNVMAEYNIDAASTAEEFSLNHEVVQGVLQKLLPEHLVLTRAASHEFTMDELKSFGNEAFVMGCEPDYNPYIFMNNQPPVPTATGLRTAGGHVHIGYHQPNEDTSILIARACDYVMGLQSVLEDKDERRKELYGSAGAMRFKPYGMEYRTLSNYWVFDDAMRRTIFERAQQAVKLVRDGDVTFDLTCGHDPYLVQEAINTNNKELARTLLGVK